MTGFASVVREALLAVAVVAVLAGAGVALDSLGIQPLPGFGAAEQAGGR